MAEQDTQASDLDSAMNMLADTAEQSQVEELQAELRNKEQTANQLLSANGQLRNRVNELEYDLEQKGLNLEEKEHEVQLLRQHKATNNLWTQACMKRQLNQSMAQTAALQARNVYLEGRNAFLEREVAAVRNRTTNAAKFHVSKGVSVVL